MLWSRLQPPTWREPNRLNNPEHLTLARSPRRNPVPPRSGPPQNDPHRLSLPLQLVALGKLDSPTVAAKPLPQVRQTTLTNLCNHNKSTSTFHEQLNLTNTALLSARCLWSAEANRRERRNTGAETHCQLWRETTVTPARNPSSQHEALRPQRPTLGFLNTPCRQQAGLVHGDTRDTAYQPG